MRKTLKDGFERITGDGNKIKGVIRSILANFRKRPKQALEKWKKFIENCRKKNFLDEARSYKLERSLNKLVKRRSSDTFSRISGAGNRVSGVLVSLISKINKIPKLAYNKWKNYIQSLKTKSFSDNMRSLKLEKSMERIIKKTLKRALVNLLNDKKMYLSALRRLAIYASRTKGPSFWNWKEYALYLKRKGLLNAQRAKMLKKTFEMIEKRTARQVFVKILGNEAFMLKKFKALAAGSAKFMKRNFDH